MILFRLVSGQFDLGSVLLAIPTLGTVTALFLLLLGDPPRERRLAALAVFGVLVCLPALAMVGLRLTGASGASR